MKVLDVIVWTLNVAMVAAIVKLSVDLVDIRRGISEDEAEYNQARLVYVHLSGGVK